MTTAAPATAPTATAVGNDLNHIYCCDPDVALCSADISSHVEVDYDEANCVVCVNLEESGARCARCGFTWRQP